MAEKPTYEELERKVEALKMAVSENEYLERVYHSIGHPVMILDPAQNIQSVNLATERLTGLSSDELKGKKCYRIFHDTAAASPPESCPFMKMLSSGAVETEEMEIETTSGSFLISCTPVFDQNNELKRIIHIGTDITEKKKAAEDLQASEERYRLLFKGSPDAIFLDDNEDRTIDANPSACRLMGYSREEFQGMSVADRQAPEVRGERGGVLKSEFEKYGDSIFESVNIRKDGTRIPVEVRTVPLNKEGLCLSILRDITERKKAEEAIIRERDLAQKYLDIAGVILVAISREQKIMLINKKGCKSLGYEEEEIIGKNWFDNFLWESDKADAKATFDQWISGKIEPAEYFESHIKCKDGQNRLIAWYNTLLKDKNDNIVGTLSSGEDITEKRKAEKALKQSEEKFRALFEYAPDGYYLNDPNGNILDGNKAAEEITGYKREELIGKNFLKLNLLPTEYMAKAKEVLKANLEGKPTGPDEFVLQAKDGRRVTVEIRTFPARIGHEDVILGIARDISKKKELEKQLRESQKMEAIGTLAGGIAHDFNNILSAVIGYTELALDDIERGTPLHAKLSEVLTAGNRAKDLVKQILAVSRHTEEVNKPIQINSLVREALKMLRSTIPVSIAIRENIGAQPLIVHGDPTRIHQVIVNLATNAMYAMTDREGILEVGVEPISFDESTAHKYPDLSPGKYARLTVSDTGVGIPEEILDKIFEPYFTTKEKGEGTGLGLSVVHGIVKSHKGHIKAYTEPGKGTAFHVYLPLAGSFSKDPSTRAAEPLPTGTESILLVDDEPPIVDMQQQRLEKLGYTVTARTGSLEALEAFRSSPGKFDLVITDMAMPHMTGDKLAHAVKQIRPDVPVILCTGFSEKVNGHEEDLAIDGFLMKPVDKAKMAKTVRKTLDKA